MKKMKKMLTAALCALMVLSGCGASNSTPQESEAEKEIETLCMNALEEQEEWKQYQRSSRSYGTRINWADETEQALAAEEYEETSSSEIYTDDATGLKYSFVYSDYTHSYELTRWNDEAGEDVYNMRFWSEEPSVDQVDLPLPEEGISCYYSYERTPSPYSFSAKLKERNDDDTQKWSLTKTEKEGEVIISLKREDLQAYNEKYGGYEPMEYWGIQVEKCELKQEEYVLVLDEDGKIIREEWHNIVDYGDGLISERNDVYEYSDLEQPTFTIEESDALIELAKARQEEIDSKK